MEASSSEASTISSNIHELDLRQTGMDQQLFLYPETNKPNKIRVPSIASRSDFVPGMNEPLLSCRKSSRLGCFMRSANARFESDVVITSSSVCGCIVCQLRDPVRRSFVGPEGNSHSSLLISHRFDMTYPQGQMLKQDVSEWQVYGRSAH